MAEKPILFSSPMVRAILEGRKTQTRRIVTPIEQVGGMDTYKGFALGSGDRPGIYCPYGAPGGSLWVRETWLKLDLDHWSDLTLPCDVIVHGRLNSVAYRADTDADGDRIRQEYGYKWRPSIFMPRWASRITLEIKAVRVERLQEISEADAQAEGVKPIWNPHGGGTINPHWHGFRELWNSINGKRASWESNPWVWAVEFEVCK